MKKRSWVVLLMGVLFCLLMVLPSPGHASVTIDGYYSHGINLDNRNESSPDPDVKTATVTTDGDVDTDGNALWASTPGWSIINNGSIVSYDRTGIDFRRNIDGHQVFWNGDVTNNNYIYGYKYGIQLNSGTVTNSAMIESGPGYGDFGGTGVGDFGGGIGVSFYGSEGALGDAILINNNTGTINGFYAGAGFSSAGGGGNVTVTNEGTINAWGGWDDYSDGSSGGNSYDYSTSSDTYGGSGGSGDFDYDDDDDFVYSYTQGGYGGDGAYFNGNGTYGGYGGYGGQGGWAYGGPGAGIYINNVATASVTNSYMINAWGGSAEGGNGGNGGSATSSYGPYTYGGNGGSGGDAYGGDGTGIYIGMPVDFHYYDDDDNAYDNMIGIAEAEVTNNAGGRINGYGGDAYGGNGGNGGAATDSGSNNGGDGGSGGHAYGGDASGIYIDGSYFAWVEGDDDDDWYYTPGSGNATVTNFGIINGHGGDAEGGDGGNGGAAYNSNASYAYGGDGSYGGYAEGGDGAGISIVSMGTAKVTNDVLGTINGYGGDARGGWGGNGADGESSGYGWISYGGNGGNGNTAEGGDGYGIFVGDTMMTKVKKPALDDDDDSTMTAEIENSGKINGYGGKAWGGFGGNGGNGYGYDFMGGYGVGGNSGNGGDGYGGDGYGIEAYNLASVTITNNKGGEINGWGGEGFGAPPGSVGTGYTASDTTPVTTYGSSGWGGSGYGGDGYGIKINEVALATIDNSGLINGYGGDGFGGDGQGGNGTGIFITDAGTVTITNNAGGEINGIKGEDEFDDDDDFIKGSLDDDDDMMSSNGIFARDTASLTVDNTGKIFGDHNGIIAFGDATTAVTVNNKEGGEINGARESGLAFFDVGTVIVDNAGTIKVGELVEAPDDDDDMVGMGGREGILINGSAFGATTSATVTNREGGLIEGHGGMEGLAVYMNSYEYVPDDDTYVGRPTTVDVQNAGTITGDNAGVSIFGDDLTTATVINDATGTMNGMDYGLRILGPNTVEVTNNEGGKISSAWDDAIYVDGYYYKSSTGEFLPGTGTVKITNSGVIKSYDEFDESYYDDGIEIMNVGSAEVINNATGTIDGYTGIEMDNIGSEDTAKVTNYGMITGHDGGNGIEFNNVANGEITNYEDGVITGYSGVWANGNTKIDNYGEITGDAGVAIDLYGGNNQVIMRTGSVFNGDIVADGNYSNKLTFDGTGETPADQIRGFNTMEKTGDGTWMLTGDQDYTTYASSPALNVQEGILALDQRSGVGGGITVASYTQNTGASLAYMVTPDRVTTGGLNVTGNANFNGGVVTVIATPTPEEGGVYALETIYPGVLTVGGTLTQWGDVTDNSALLEADLVENGDQIYDLVLNRLSFTAGADESTLPLAQLLDDIYYDATDEMRDLLDELLLLGSMDEVARALAQISGGTHTAFQALSFNGIGKYLGVLNNHIFGTDNHRFGVASNGYRNGVQLAMAGGGNSMNDMTPVLLAMAGGAVGQTQVASGTNWGLWADAYISRGNRRSSELIAKYEDTIYGGIFGFDYRVANDLFLGVSLGVSSADLKFDTLQDKGSMESYYGSAYLCYDGKPWYATGVLTYGRNHYDLDRFITIGPITEIANSDYSGNEFVGYGEVGFKINAGGAEIRPLLAFQADYLWQEAFTETGAGIFNLYVDSHSTGSYQSFVGVNLSGAIKLGDSAVLKPEASIKWAHEFSNDDHMINARFAGAGSGSFRVASEELNRDTAIIGVGMNLMFNKNVAAYFQYEGQLNEDYINHSGLIGLRFAW